jgi:arginase
VAREVSKALKSKIEIIGVPLDLGADRRGVDMGPSAIRYADLSERLRALGFEVSDTGDLETPILDSSKIVDASAKYIKEVQQVGLRLMEIVERTVSRGKFPLILGGDHSVAIGTLAGLSKARGKCGVIWMDAHGDFNTPATTPSGNIHGMGLAIVSGLAGEWFPMTSWPFPAVDLARVAIVGVRNLDEKERELLRSKKIHVYTMADIDRKGMQSVMEDAISVARGERGEAVHVSFDIDVVDPSEAPGVGTPVRGGITYREAHLSMEMISEAKLLSSFEMVEVNPILDQQNTTADLAVELILSAMGKTII